MAIIWRIYVGGDYSIEDDELLVPLRDFSGKGEDPDFENNDDENDNVCHSSLRPVCEIWGQDLGLW